MKLKIYQVDAFTDRLFGGNPAAVVPLEDWLDDETMQNIALENNLSETAFFVPRDGHYHLRWFTPTIEVDLCGHATLATGFVLYKHLGYSGDFIKFFTQSGEVFVNKINEDVIALDFPAWIPEQIEIPEALTEGLGISPLSVYKTRDCIALLENEYQVFNLKPEMSHFLKLDQLCIIATSPGDHCDFVSRVFVPAAGIPEDPVTGSAHSSLIPFWAMRLGKNRMSAIQLSKRQGYLQCELRGDRVSIGGKCVTYMTGEISV